MWLKKFLIGKPIPTAREKHERLSKVMGLAIFSSDALSSVAYGTEEILLALFLAGTALVNFTLPVAMAITLLIAIVAVSYYQIIHAYPTGGGAYIVAKENLGINTGLVAGAALMIDYVMTVAVSITAGIAAITSAFPFLFEHKVALAVISILIIMIANLRGVRESGKIFTFPSYLFIFCILLMISVGFFKAPSTPLDLPRPGSAEVGLLGIAQWFIVLRAFASGCATLTGIEAMANGVRAFKPPESKNTGITLIWLAIILGSMFMGISFLAHQFAIVPTPDETVLSKLARIVFGNGFFYYITQFATSLILILAVNTSFAGFPRLASNMASDRFLPRQFTNLGDKLVYSNGIIILGSIASLLVILFGGYTHALIPLYAIGVFLSFSLSQTGMVRHWWRTREAGWVRAMIINAIGAVTTTIVLIVVAVSKFSQGAWMVLIAIPAIVIISRKIYTHYVTTGEQLAVLEEENGGDFKYHSVIIPVSGIHKAVLGAVKYGKVLSNDVKAIYVCADRAKAEKMQEDWDKYGSGVPLVILESPYRSVLEPVLKYIDDEKEKHKDGVITVVLPEFVPSKWWHYLLHNQTALLIKGYLLFKKGVVSTSVPLRLKR
jgi:amino acid transporter